MIHHISIPARQPAETAEVLARLLGSRVQPFPMYPGSYAIFAHDDSGCIEIYPADRHLEPSTPELPALVESARPSLHSAFHAALSVPVSEEEIAKACADAGWLCQKGPRGGFFEVVEVWVENQVLLELLTPDMAERYVAFATRENWARTFEA